MGQRANSNCSDQTVHSDASLCCLTEPMFNFMKTIFVNAAIITKPLCRQVDTCGHFGE